MRQTAFGDYVVESKEDDMGEAFMETPAEDCYARVYEGEEGKFAFEVVEATDGEEVVSSDDVFESEVEARRYVKGWVSDVQT